MFLVHVNYLAVLLSAIASMVMGALWYGPLFGKPWMKMVGMTKDKMAKAKKGMNQSYGFMFVGSLIMAYVLAHFIWYAAPGSFTVMIAVKTAVWAWLGFIAPAAASKFLFSPDKKPVQLLVIDAGYYLATLIVMGVIFGVLR